MFGQNEIVGQKHFREAPMNSLLVTSIFYTLQGEGPFAGRPAVFVRLAKCNLACSFCDTYFDSGDWMTFGEIAAKAREVRAGRAAQEVVLVITGGEPSLQANLVGFLFDQLGHWDDIQIESNGTIPIRIPSGVTLVISPKCTERDGFPERYLTLAPGALDAAHCLKFVVERSGSRPSPYSEIPEWAFKWRERTGKPIYISPMNRYLKSPQAQKTIRFVNQPTLEERNAAEVVSFWTPDLLDMEANEQNHKYAARYCLEHGLRLTLQMHLYAGLA